MRMRISARGGSLREAALAVIATSSLEDRYCNTAQPAQVEPAVVGVDWLVGTSKCRTPSSFEQKFRTPVWLNEAAEPPTV